MSYSELLIALENIIIDKVATVPTARNRKTDTSAPMEIEMAAKEDRKVRVKREIKGSCRLCSAGCMAKESGVLARGRIGMRKAARVDSS